MCEQMGRERCRDSSEELADPQPNQIMMITGQQRGRERGRDSSDELVRSPTPSQIGSLKLLKRCSDQDIFYIERF